MPNSERETIENLIRILNCHECVKVFKQKRSFIFNFAMIWNLFEDRCMGNFARISEVNNFIESLISIDNLDVGTIFNYFKNRYTKPDGEFNINGLNWRSSENTYRDFVIEKFKDNQCSHKDKVITVLYIIFRLRNNLFHGEKNIAIINEQKRTFVLVNKFLMDLITLKVNG